MLPRIYIDGASGTTGLQIKERLKKRDDIELVEIDPDKRHDPHQREKMMAIADLTFFCLPDDAAKEAEMLASKTDTKVIDCSTAHRTEWVYGFPELNRNQKEAIRKARFTANPGCHATGVIAILNPLQKELKKLPPMHFVSLTGYSGGGKSMIAQYENNKTAPMESPKPYSLTKEHKHIREIKALCAKEDITLTPIVCDFKQGMLVMTELDTDKTSEEILQLYKDWYDGTDIEVLEMPDSLYASELAGTDRLQILVTTTDTGVQIMARFDNLGKGACGAAIRNMNLMLGLEETAGLQMK